MKYFINLDKGGKVVGLFRNEQYPGQKTLDEVDAKVVAYKDAKAERVSLAGGTLEARVAELEAKALETKT